MGVLSLCSIIIFMVKTSFGFVRPPYEYGQHETYIKINRTLQKSEISKMELEEPSVLPLILSADKKELQNTEGHTEQRTDFKAFRKDNAIFVDKTQFIYDFMTDRSKHAAFITRPPGFGKTLMHSMFYYFFSSREQATDVFKGTKIAQKEDFCRKHQNRYPVIRMSFAGFGGINSNAAAEKKLRTIFNDTFLGHKYLLTERPKMGQVYLKNQERYFKEITETSAPLDTLSTAIWSLSHFLHDQFNKSVIILIDDYDGPILSELINGYSSDMTDFIKKFLRDTFEDNRWIERSLVLGTIADKKLISNSHYDTYSVAENIYATCFGFTRTETEELIRKYGLPKDLITNMMGHYGGYHLGEETILNPWSVVHSLENNCAFLDYWVDSKLPSDFIQFIIKNGNILTVFESEVLLRNFSIKYTRNHYIDESYTKFADDINLFWSLLTDIGYLTIVKKKGSYPYFEYQVVLPNTEVSRLFAYSVDHYYAKKKIPSYKKWTEMLRSTDMIAVQNVLKTYIDMVQEEITNDGNVNSEASMKRFLQALLEGFRKFYNEITIRVEGSSVIADTKGGSEGLPSKITFRVRKEDDKWKVEFCRFFKVLKEVDICGEVISTEDLTYDDDDDY